MGEQGQERYSEETPPGWSDAVAQSWTVETVADGLRLAGACPTCRHATETRVQRVTLVPGFKAAGAPEALPILVACECTDDHEGRPAGRTGCGRAAYLELVDDQS